LTGENIICLAKDWSEDPTSNNHVMLQLAERNRVVWVNSLSTRTPSLSSGRDLGKIFRKVASFFQGPRRVHDRLWVYTPLVLPFPHSKLALALNSWILRFSLAGLRRRLRIRDFQLWTFLPNVAEYVGKLGESLVVYYCVDDWAKFNYLDGEKTAAAEGRLCERADVVFVTVESLAQGRQTPTGETHVATHGVDHELFSRALTEGVQVPADMAELPGPVLGFYGTIQDWVDLDLIAYLAERHPEWTIVMIGRVAVDVSRFIELPNVHFLGRRPHSELPAYCKSFAVGLIPYILNERILHVNPIKLREYLCAGLPVVSTPVPEVQRYGEYCGIAATFEEFERAVETALYTDSPDLRRTRSEAMRSETWERKVAEVSDHVMRVKAKRCPNA
jgi:glycosyltransferase involved in cell wall biosynthesis